MADASSPLLTSRFRSAMQFSLELHASQLRKSTQVPYIAHLLAVAALVLEDGGDEDQAIAALLHDAVEDQGGMRTLEEIRRRYGDQVAAIVAACTDTYEDPKPPWRGRKEAYLQHLAGESQAALRVSLADKVHNGYSIVRDLRIFGDEIWSRFNGGKEGTLWYYRSLLAVFQSVSHSRMAADLETIVREMVELAG
jgi:(p)ppGpp synthase/HD superfamily hydrolase